MKKLLYPGLIVCFLFSVLHTSNAMWQTPAELLNPKPEKSKSERDFSEKTGKIDFYEEN